MFPQRIIKQLTKELVKKDTKKILYTYSGFSFPIKKDAPKKPTKSVHEYQAYH